MRPFEDVRVLDLTHVLAGPFATFQLAVLGADVIKIEAPDRPDMTRNEGVSADLNDAHYGTYFLGQNGGKRSLTLDLATPEGRGILGQLIARADVLVQNYSGAGLDEHGFGAETALEINPRLIYCSMTGFGRTGPKQNDPAYDIIIQAFSGIMAANGTADTSPVRVGPPMVDYGTGAQAALAISAALYQR
ncbi:MAG: CoA transferase, partial [Pseudomonadota bacterium]